MSRAPDITAKVAYLTNRANSGGKPVLKAKRPLYLKDRVRGSKNLGEVNKGCSKESDAFFQCLEENDYLDASCMKELSALMNCDKKIQDARQKQAKKFAQGEKVKGKLSASAVNALLKKYPNPVSKEGLIIQQNLLNTLPMNRIKPFPYKNKWNPSPEYDNGLTTTDM